MSAYIPSELQRQIRSQFIERCAYCQTAEALTATIFEFEHIIPRSAGGATQPGNLCFACPTCNRYKGERQTFIDPITEEAVPLFHPQRQQWSEHFAWSEDGITLIGQTAVGRATIEALKINRPQMIRVRGLWIRLGEHPPNLENRAI